jgi:hypothetical protein
MPAPLTFPNSPSLGDLYPADPGTSGVTQYRWDGGKWNAVLSTVNLGTANQGAYNQYQWPAADGTAGQQLTTDGTGTLTWDVPSNPSLQIINLLEPFDNVRQSFTLVEYGTVTPFIPSPSTNLVVFLGGVPQIPTAAYAVPTGTSTINFTEAPLSGATFYAISNILV